MYLLRKLEMKNDASVGTQMPDLANAITKVRVTVNCQIMGALLLADS